MFFTRGQAITFIESVFGPAHLTKNGREANVSCPICKDPRPNKKKLAVKTDGSWVCHCWVCGYKSRNLVWLIKKYFPYYLGEYLGKFVGTKLLLHESELQEQEENAFEHKLTIPQGFELLAVNSSQEYIDYLNKRFDGEVTIRELWYWKFGITTEDHSYKRRIIIPSHDEDGELNYFVGRTIDPYIRPKYLNPIIPRENIIYNEINISWVDPLVIVEGPLDLIKCNQNATCLLGSDLTPEYKLFEFILKHKTPVILGLDNDAKHKTNSIAHMLHEYDINVKILQIPKPYNDIGEIPRNHFTSILNAAMVYDMNYNLKARIANIV